jgi:hypothetical protein
MTVDIWIRDYNPPRCFQKKISGRGKHNGTPKFQVPTVKLIFINFLHAVLWMKPNLNAHLLVFLSGEGGQTDD